MKSMRTILFFTLAVVLTGTGLFAQSSSNQVPGPTDYAAFTRFITDRNIFDPNRQPHYSSTRTRTASHTRTRTVSASAPAFSLVGTMSYEKGIFAFFSGNSDELKKALLVSGKIAGYTVTDISYGRVTLESTNENGKLELKVGDVMREDNGKWEMTGQGEVSAGSSSSRSQSSSTSMENSGTHTDSENSTPASTGAPNDILKRLMEQRAKENQ